MRVPAYGAGGVSVNIQDKTTKICPDKSEGKCCEVEISGNDIRVITSMIPFPADFYEDGNYTLQSYEVYLDGINNLVLEEVDKP